MSARKRATNLIALAVLASSAQAATMPCGVGWRVYTELSSKIGTIEEIGTEAPHVGWFRISYDWAPAGEWYSPAIVDIFPEATQDRCQPPGASAAQPQPAAAAPASNASPVSSGLASTQTCPGGRRVVDREHRAGTVRGERNGMCVVELDSGGGRSYLAWMLEPEGGKPAAGGSLTPGRYACSAGAAGTFPVEIVDGSSYVDRAGTRGSYSLDGDGIDFASGSLTGYYARVLGNGKFGLSSKAARSFSVVCNRK